MIGHLFRYMCAKNYRNKWSSDKAVAKNKMVQFFCLTWYITTWSESDIISLQKCTKTRILMLNFTNFQGATGTAPYKGQATATLPRLHPNLLNSNCFTSHVNISMDNINISIPHYSRIKSVPLIYYQNWKICIHSNSFQHYSHSYLE